MTTRSFDHSVDHTTTYLTPLAPDANLPLPAPIIYRTAKLEYESSYPQHTHPWGEFVCAYSGVMEVSTQQRHYLVPPQYGLWLPPDTAHRGFIRAQTYHCSVYINTPARKQLPTSPCTLMITPLIREILAHLRDLNAQPPYTAELARLLQVLVDQLSRAQSGGSYLPATDDSLIAGAIELLSNHPATRITQAELAHQLHCTERTLARRAQKQLGMSLHQWQQRHKIVVALARLDRGDTVEQIALDLGYSSASAFIAVFKRMNQQTPDGYRKRN